MTVFNIDIVSDTICPWCYIGKRKLDQAITKYKAIHPDEDDKFVFNWKPFYLYPDAPKKKGLNKAWVYATTMGEQGTRDYFKRVAQVGDTVGIKFKFGGDRGNTRDSHRLSELAKIKGGLELQNRVVEALLSAYHEQELDTTRIDVLTKIGVDSGLDEKEVTEWLASDAGGDIVDQEAKDATESNISGVPNFAVGPYNTSGAQDPSVFLRMLESAKRMDVQKAKRLAESTSGGGAAPATGADCDNGVCKI